MKNDTQSSIVEEATPSTALTVQDRAAVALGSSKTRQDLAALVAKSANINEIKNKAGRDECHAAAMALVKARTTIQKIGKEAPALEAARAAIALATGEEE